MATENFGTCPPCIPKQVKRSKRADFSPVKLCSSLYQQATIDVAKQLLGKHLVRRHEDGCAVGRIVETEAYIGPQDLACHASKGRTARTEVMFGPAGHAYVYFIYGFYNMLNLVTEAKDYPAAVLIRAVEPVDGIELMKERRKTNVLHNLASGPGKLCQAFAVDRSLNGVNLCGNILYVEDRGEPTPKFRATARIGVDYAGKWKTKPYRFLVRGSEFVSKI
ncbi:MAG: DNA-3-methyladenine glycosylase [Candidatus Binatia bacterium]